MRMSFQVTLLSIREVLDVMQVYCLGERIVGLLLHVHEEDDNEGTILRSIALRIDRRWRDRVAPYTINDPRLKSTRPTVTRCE